MGMGSQWDISGAINQPQAQHAQNSMGMAQPPAPTPPLVTIYMKDFRRYPDNPDHFLAELRMPLIQDDTQWVVCADEMIRKLQSTPGRIDGESIVLLPLQILT